ncbi:zinc finger MYM-type protein 1-like [Melanotaenia boesemani]|uniref:zinc finger MYM-type protein 1-like n=1 Tax=Melanotaenia boesemani TaxID=1250792 RepID=UPI001C050F31|nr:zinc finger MYM-type protein 1-like [Melanotaenia boesemani]
MKRKGSIYSFFTPKRKAREIDNELSEADIGDEVEGQREDEDEVEGERGDVEGERDDKHEVEVEGEDKDELEGEREEQQKRNIDDQGQEEVGEHLEEGKHHQKEKAKKQQSERERTVPEPSPATFSRAGPHDVSKSRCEVPTQPKRESFPKTLQGGARRSFRSEWYQANPWLEYSQSKDAAYCFACRHFSLPDTPKTVFTSFDGYRNWKKATMKDSGFASHARSECHINAMFAWTENKKNMDKNSSMFGRMDEQKKKQVAENQHYIKTLAEILVLTVTENIAQRGHRESQDSEQKGVFLSMLDLLGNHDPIIKKRLEQHAKNAKYTSKTIQNEILECLAAMVKETIIQEVKTSKQFSVIVDETKDVQKKEQMSFVLRYYYNGMVHESFLEFDVAEHLDAAALSCKIINFLERHGLQYKKNLVGQGYDGAAVMRGAHAGVQAKIKEVAKHAFYVHCSAHCLNLVIVDTVKSVPDAGNFFSLLERLYVFVSGSYVHNKWLEVQREMFDGAPRELQKLSDTRWACRHIACRSVMDRLPAVVQVLEEIGSENHPQRAVEARGILAQIDLNFAGSLVLFRKVLSDSKFLSDMLQSKTVDYAKAVELIEALKETLVTYRSQTSFDEMWTEILDLCKQSNIDITQRKSKRPRQTTKVLQGSVINSTLGQHVVPDSKDTFCVSVYYPVLDNMIEEIGRRFSNTNCNIMQGVQALNPSSPTFLTEEAVLLLANAYGSNIEDLKHELHQTKRVLDRKKGEKESPTTLMEFTQFLDPYQDVFFELFRLCKIAVVLPVSSASCERSFSSLRLIKTYLRSTMTEKRLSNLAVLSIESKRTKELDLEKFVKRFAEQHGNRRIQLL